jgi:two-component system sensor histidine kinase AlgZ
MAAAEPAQAEAVLEDLSELFRYALADPAESVTLDQEIALAKRYLAIEQIRFGDRLQVQWSLDPEANNTKLPPLLLQPLVENAVRHGVEPSAGGAQIKISTLRRGPMVVLKVTNTTPPAVVFVTAHAEYAVQAFEVEAVDYLTKPVRFERLQQALQKVERLAQVVPQGRT